jgi:hypothetical protein
MQPNYCLRLLSYEFVIIYDEKKVMFSSKHIHLNQNFNGFSLNSERDQNKEINFSYFKYFVQIQKKL